MDLLVGSPLFRDHFVRGGARGHFDLPRARAIGVNVVGLTVATSWPDVRGSLSHWHFRSLGMPRSVASSRMAIAEWLIGRIEQWSAEATGKLLIIRTADDLDRCVAPDGPLGVVLGVQGGHVLEGDLRNVRRLRDLGVRMLAPAHVMDNDAVGSGTGATARGLTEFGRELVAELEAQAIAVDLAHMSVLGIRDALSLLRRPFLVSHTGVSSADGAGRRGIRRYSAQTRNVPFELAREIGTRGGLVGVVLATQLLGGVTLRHATRMFRRAIDACGETNVALGSDMDGALRMVVDVQGLPALADALLESGLSEATVSRVLGGNAVGFLRRSLS